MIPPPAAQVPANPTVYLDQQSWGGVLAQWFTCIAPCSNPWYLHLHSSWCERPLLETLMSLHQSECALSIYLFFVCIYILFFSLMGTQNSLEHGSPLLC